MQLASEDVLREVLRKYPTLGHGLRELARVLPMGRHMTRLTPSVREVPFTGNGRDITLSEMYERVLKEVAREGHHWTATGVQASSAVARSEPYYHLTKNLSVGSVVRVEDGDDETKEDTFYMVVSVVGHPGCPHLVGTAVWLPNKEQLCKMGAEAYAATLEPEEVVVSNQLMELDGRNLKLEPVGFLWPQLLWAGDNAQENDVFTCAFFDVRTGKLHFISNPERLDEPDGPFGSKILLPLQYLSLGASGWVRVHLPFYPARFRFPSNILVQSPNNAVCVVWWCGASAPHPHSASFGLRNLELFASVRGRAGTWGSTATT